MQQSINITAKQLDQMFNQFWSRFPNSDAWGDFPQCRFFKNDREDCRLLYADLIRAGAYTHEEMLAALSSMIEDKKNASIFLAPDIRINYLSDLQNIKFYLKFRVFSKYVKRSLPKQSAPFFVNLNEIILN